MSQNMIPEHVCISPNRLTRLFIPVSENSKGFDMKKSLNAVSISPLKRNRF